MAVSLNGQPASKNDTATQTQLEVFFAGMFFTHDTTTPISLEYKTYYPTSIEFANKGGLHLVKLPFFSWAVELLKIIILSYNEDNITIDRRWYITNAMKQIKENAHIFKLFDETAQKLNSQLDIEMRKRIHLRIVLFVFRAYTSYKNTNRFNRQNESAHDTSGVAHRTKVRLGGKDNKVEITTAAISTTENQNEQLNRLTKELGVDLGERQAGKSRAEKTEECKIHYDEAIAKLKQHGLDNFTTHLQKKHLASILTHGFGKYTSKDTNTLQALKDKVSSAISDPVKKDAPFWTKAATVGVSRNSNANSNLQQPACAGQVETTSTSEYRATVPPDSYGNQQPIQTSNHIYGYPYAYPAYYFNTSNQNR